jgi:hypothetical protein
MSSQSAHPWGDIASTLITLEPSREYPDTRCQRAGTPPPFPKAKEILGFNVSVVGLLVQVQLRQGVGESANLERRLVD